VGAIAVLALAGCSSGFSRSEFASYGGQQSSSSDQIVTSSLPPVPSEPVYGSSSGSQYAARSNSSYGYNRDRNYGQARNANYAPAAVERKSLPPAPMPAVARSSTGGSVTVKRGDTLYSLSRDHGVPINSIKTANNMTSTYLEEGQSIVIPSGRIAAKPGIHHHRVKRGESLAVIARQYGTSHAELARANAMTDPDRLQPGDVVKVPQGGQAVADASRAPSIAVPRIKKVKTRPVRVASASPNVPIPSSKPDRGPLPKKQASTPKPKPKKVASIGKLPKPKPMSGSKFRWPARGRIISSYGAKSNGKHNDGINIAVPQGTSIKAAENGVVAYAGNELKGYGNLILVRHDNNWVSAYAHSSKILVKRGDKIRRGQIIAKAGQSGLVNRPQLHFELRKGSRPVDPRRHMTGT
jgi:murein DD-endopeptidase MepM/ murein hydrolase activator NlpD